ncbi:MAG: hypothetical protein PHI93_07245 [Kiritimatiellae bacterium]|jgi:hypothetical protein|nr:hypothetical protein [Kiritimatiellia bacterium]MDY0150599.1 hypothetical protein [Kiritimatiellia bacterium]
MKALTTALILLGLGCVQMAAAGDIQTEWAYHSAGSESRLIDRVPGTDLTFLANGSDALSTSETVTLYVLTAQNFAGNLDEQVSARWWNGTRAHWVMGYWVGPVEVSATENTFRGHPAEGSTTLDLWRITIPPLVTRPGDNFYAIQLKAYQNGHTDERYLLCRTGGDFSRTNRLGQIWSSSEEFAQQDWKIQIQPEP